MSCDIFSKNIRSNKETLQENIQAKNILKPIHRPHLKLNKDKKTHTQNLN